MKKILTATSFLVLLCIQCYAQQTRVIAHRGAWKNENLPQNSIASLEKAISLKVWGTEFDVHLTKDDILVVNHDNDFYGMDIATSTYAELLTQKHPNGEPIPTAEAYIKTGMKQDTTKLIFELKANRLGKDRTLKSVALSLNLVRKLGAFDKIEFIAFDYDACLKFRELDEHVKVHYLMGDKSPQEIYQAKISGIDYHYNVFKNNPTWIQECKPLGLFTNTWTVNTKEDMHYFLDQKIDFITTDQPELLLELLQ